MLHSVALVSHAGSGHYPVGSEYLPHAILTALSSHTVKYPERLPLGSITVITRMGGAVVLHATTAGYEDLTSLIASACKVKM